MVERTSYVDGEPCWADVMARDAEASRRFYAKVLGWTYEISGPEYGAYAQCMSAGTRVAGMMPWYPEMGDTPTAWSLYLSTSDIDAAAESVKSAGGRITIEPMDVPSAGRMAFGADPTGAVFGLWQAGEHHGFGGVGELGEFAWAELVTRSPAEADQFYKGLFRYEQRQTGTGDVDYEIWTLGGKEVCGRMKMPPDVAADPAVPSCWSLYFAIDDTDRAAAKAIEAGGTVLHEPHDSPYGRMARIRDPEGAQFHIIDLARRSP